MKRGRILVVEDDQDIRESLKELLEDEGYEVSAAEDGVRALLLLEQGQAPDLILLDLMMPVVNGYQFRSKQLEHAQWRSIPTVVLTADERARAEMRSLEVQTLLFKPIKLEALFQVLEDHLG